MLKNYASLDKKLHQSKSEKKNISLPALVKAISINRQSNINLKILSQLKKIKYNSDYSEFVESMENEISNEVNRIRAEFLKTRIEKLKDRFIIFFKSGVKARPSF